MYRKQNRGQRRSTSEATVETLPVSMPVTQATKSVGSEFKFGSTALARNGEHLPEEPRGGAGTRSGGWGTRRPAMSGNELPMTQEWRGPGQTSCGDTQRAGVGSGLVFGRDGTGVQGRRSGGRTWWFRGRSVNAYGHTPPRMGALRQADATPHTLHEDATRNHGRVGYQINRESPNTKMVRRSANVAVSGPLAQSGHRVHNLTFRPALLVAW